MPRATMAPKEVQLLVHEDVHLVVAEVLVREALAARVRETRGDTGQPCASVDSHRCLARHCHLGELVLGHCQLEGLLLI
jgi:hypothetical protein